MTVKLACDRCPMVLAFPGDEGGGGGDVVVLVVDDGMGVDDDDDDGPRVVAKSSRQACSCFKDPSN